MTTNQRGHQRTHPTEVRSIVGKIACDLCRQIPPDHSPLCPVVTMGELLKRIPL